MKRRKNWVKNHRCRRSHDCMRDEFHAAFIRWRKRRDALKGWDR
jgi:hypothetical protein